MIITFLNQKGGVGKTTLSCGVATALAADGAKVALIDADPQRGAMAWSEHREDAAPFAVLGIASDKLHREVARLASDYAHIVIDPPPGAAGIARAAIVAADVVAIPVQPSPHDIWAAQTIIDLLDEAAPIKPKLKAVFVINRKIANTALGRDVAAALEAYPYPVARQAIAQRVAHAEAATAGLTALDTEPSGAAALEIRTLTLELLEVHNGSKSKRTRKGSKTKGAGGS